MRLTSRDDSAQRAAWIFTLAVNCRRGNFFPNRKFHRQSVLATVPDNAAIFSSETKAAGRISPLLVALLFRASRAKSRAECLGDGSYADVCVAGVAVSAFTSEQTGHSGHGRASPRYPITCIWVSVLSYARCWCHREYGPVRAYRRAEDAGTCIYWFLAEVTRGRERERKASSFRLPSTALCIDMHVLGAPRAPSFDERSVNVAGNRVRALA